MSLPTLPGGGEVAVLSGSAPTGWTFVLAVLAYSRSEWQGRVTWHRTGFPVGVGPGRRDGDRRTDIREWWAQAKGLDCTCTGEVYSHDGGCPYGQYVEGVAA